MTIRITEAAAADITEIFRWYRDQREGLEYGFRRSLDACLSRVRRSPEGYACVHNEIRRALLMRFPYAVFFIVEESEITVIGVFHGRRDPTVWQRRSEA